MSTSKSLSLTDIKRELYNHCQQYVEQRIKAAQEAIDAAQHAANDETKSSSGDKYETGRAMMQLEIEKNTVQLSESLKLKHTLEQINPAQEPVSVQAGSLVITDRETFFIAISIGKVELLRETYLVISPASPIGQKLLGLKTGSTMTFQGRITVGTSARTMHAWWQTVAEWWERGWPPS